MDKLWKNGLLGGDTTAQQPVFLSVIPPPAAEGSAQNGFLVDQATRTQCDACHQVLRHDEGGRGQG